MRDAARVHELQRYGAGFHLLDAYSPRTPGGTAESFDWKLSRLHPDTPPVVPSGGLAPDNVGAAREAGGRKDPAKLTAFMSAVEPADACLGAAA